MPGQGKTPWPSCTGPSQHARVIVWLNRTSGYGKTVTAAELRGLIPSSRVFDPETAGLHAAAQPRRPPVTDFQHWPPWRRLVVATATEPARFTGQQLTAPQTVLDRGYLDQVSAGLRDAGPAVSHVVLDADYETLRQRIHGSAQAQP